VYPESGIYSDYFQAWNILRKVTTVDDLRDFFREYGQRPVTSKGQVNGKVHEDIDAVGKIKDGRK
jgi:hypothetical protein